MRYFVLEAEADARATIATIDAAARAIFAARGYTIREDGAVIGKRDGADDPAGVTTTWAEPVQRADGKWIVPHPETQPSAQVETGNGRVVDILTAGIVAPIEEASPDWWPPLPTP